MMGIVSTKRRHHVLWKLAHMLHMVVLVLNRFHMYEVLLYLLISEKKVWT